MQRQLGKRLGDVSVDVRVAVVGGATVDVCAHVTAERALALHHIWHGLARATGVQPTSLARPQMTAVATGRRSV